MFSIGDIFNIGNLLTMALVAVVLAVYRQLDQNNRSLEKIKRYSDKITGELDGFVDDKTVELKNLSIELDAHQKRGKEILKRITFVEDGLDEKSSAIDAMYKRIDDYDNAINELVGMTGKVKENLDRLQKESEFVDKVGRQIKDANVKMVQIEKNIPALKHEFAKENSRELKILSTEVLKRSKKIAASIESGVAESDNKIREFSGYLDSLEERRDSLEKETFANIDNTFEEYLGKAEQTGNDILEEYRSEASVIEQDYSERFNLIAEKGKSLEHEVFTNLKKHISESAGEVDSSFSDWRGRIETFETGIESRIGTLESEMTRNETEIEHKYSRITEIGGELQTLDNNLREAMEGVKTAIKSDFSEFENGLELKKNQIREMAESGIRSANASIEQIDNDISELKQNFHAKMGGKLAELETGFTADLEQRNIAVDKQLEAVVNGLDENIGNFENRVNTRLGDVEVKISEYEGDIAYRFVKIEEVCADIDNLESNLKQVMERVTERIRSDFKDFENKLGEQRVEAGAKADNDIKMIHDTMNELEKEIVELKSTAYDNVSEKLQVFEDEFFSDLKQRNQSMQDQLLNWQKEVDVKLDDISVDNENTRIRVEKEYEEALKARLAELQNKIYQLHEKLESQVSGFQTRTDERMNLASSTLKGFEESIKKDIQEARDNSRVFFQKEFTDHNTTISDRIIRYERDTETQLKELGGSLETGKKELVSVMETAQSDLVVWQAKVLQSMKDAELAANDEVTGFKANITGNIAVLKDDFNTQREDLIISTQEERARLKTEVKELSDNVIELEGDLRKKTETSLETFNRDYENFSLEIQKKYRDMQMGADQKIKDFRSDLSTIRGKMEQMQKKLFGSVEDNAKSLSLTLQEIEKKQKNFLNQTKLFDRADSLKIALQEKIEDLRLEIARVDAQGKEIKEAERKFLSIKKTGDEIDSKLTRFLAEKRRIEDMEGDFKKLINISQAVDVKLDQVVTSHDELQEIQVRIRKVEELEKEIEQKYDRLEKKKYILNDTTEGVDKNFQHLEVLNAKFHDIENGLAIIPGKIVNMESQLKVLTQNKQKADQAVKQLVDINKMLDDINTRTQKMEKARDWLARTETRLEEVSTQAQEQVKLLGTIMKDSAKPGKGDKGAPAMGAREVVTRLAHQGWSVQEIARATKLSRGEVELILELLPRT